jgi:hypothetical protein
MRRGKSKATGKRSYAAKALELAIFRQKIVVSSKVYNRKKQNKTRTSYVEDA